MNYVTVHLHSMLEQGSATRQLAVEGVVKLAKLQELVGVPAGQVGMALVNGELSWDDTEVAPGATVDFYPPIAGG